MAKKIVFLFFIFLAVHFMVSGQSKKEFSSDPKIFVNELKTFFNGSQDKEAQDALAGFMIIWQANTFTSDEITDIINTCNMLLKQRGNPSPEFRDYLKLVNGYIARKSNDKLAKYNAIIQQMLVKNKKDFNSFTTACITIVYEQAIVSSSSKKWTISSNDYDFTLGKEPGIVFSGLDLQLYTQGDTLGIYETQGTFYPASNKWAGQGGKVYWTRVGFAKTDAFAEINKYNIDTRGSEFSADSVHFTYTKIFDQPILGKLVEKATTTNQGDKALYPRFSSYQNVFVLKNVFKNVDYQGGFTLQGAQILGTGLGTQLAYVTIRYDDKPKVRAYSKTFSITPDRISALKAGVSIYEGNDSIYHSQLDFNYLESSRKMTLSRSEIGLYAAPFYDNYHHIEFTIGNIFWYIDSSEMTMRTITNPGSPASFESSDRYSASTYDEQQSILNYNPISKMAGMAVITNKDTGRVFSVDEVAGYFSNKPEYIQSLLLQLAREGFIFYDIDAQKVVLKDKLLHYAAAYEKGVDYDNIHFQSVISGKPNVTLNLTNNEFGIEGVTKIQISDSQQTYFVPQNQQVKIKKNRDMLFDGEVHSGRFDFFGKNLFFDYNKFKVALDDIDSVKFRFPEYDKDGKFMQLRLISTTIENVTGFVYIDDPKNKSGRKNIVKYPTFDCTKESFVYYERPYIYHSVYKRDKFYFKIDPFIIENLDKFTAEGLKFPGTFVSANIIPEIQEALRIQEDFSLGFINRSPEKGYSLYQGKGKGIGTFMLSNKGFRENGEIDYLVSNMHSHNYILFPDSTNGISDTFQIAEGSKYPPVFGKVIYNHWSPYNDSLYIYKRKENFSVYNGKVDFSGSLILTPAELVGQGKAKYHDVSLVSNSFAFFATEIKTQSAELTLTSDASKEAALQASDVNADINLKKDFGKFKTNDDTGTIRMPSNRFITNLNNFTYDLSKREVVFTKPEGMDDDSAYFTSTNPSQLGLRINSKRAVYDLGKLDITAQEVPSVFVADSRIYSPKQEILIQKGGTIGGISGAIIVANDKDRFHKIYDAYVNIFSFEKFTGYGKYDYLDKNQSKFTINFSDIHTTPELTTEALGIITDSSNFYLSPKIKYQGKVTLVSTQKTLAFDGFVLADHGVAALGTTWAKVVDTIDPQDVILNIDQPVGKDNRPLFTGTFLTMGDSQFVYNRLFGKKIHPNDLEIFTTTGIFYYDDKKQEYVVGDKAKIFADTDDVQTGGSYFKYKVKPNKVYTTGLYNFGQDNKYTEITTGGDYTFNLKDSSNKFSLMLWFNFPFHDDLNKLMSDNILANSYGLEDTKNDRFELYNALALLIKDKKSKEKVISELSTTGFIASTDVINKNLFLSSLTLKYVDSLHAFISTGTLGLATIKKVNIYKEMQGKVQIIHTIGTSDFSVLLQTNENNYLYFDYKGTILSYISSDDNFNAKVAQLAPKITKGQGNYQLKLADVNDVTAMGNKKKKHINYRPRMRVNNDNDATPAITPKNNNTDSTAAPNPAHENPVTPDTVASPKENRNQTRAPAKQAPEPPKNTDTTTAPKQAPAPEPAAPAPTQTPTPEPPKNTDTTAAPKQAPAPEPAAPAPTQAPTPVPTPAPANQPPEPPKNTDTTTTTKQAPTPEPAAPAPAQTPTPEPTPAPANQTPEPSKNTDTTTTPKQAPTPEPAAPAPSQPPTPEPTPAPANQTPEPSKNTDTTAAPQPNQTPPDQKKNTNGNGAPAGTGRDINTDPANNEPNRENK